MSKLLFLLTCAIIFVICTCPLIKEKRYKITKDIEQQVKLNVGERAKITAQRFTPVNKEGIKYCNAKNGNNFSIIVTEILTINVGASSPNLHITCEYAELDSENNEITHFINLRVNRS